MHSDKRFQGMLPAYSLAAPALGWLLLLLGRGGFGEAGWYLALMVLALGACVLAAVHHAEVVAQRVGEPFGTLVLALAVTAIEVALIVSLMVSQQSDSMAMARDTVFAAVMIILNGMLGLCLLVGGHKHREQVFNLQGASSALATLAAIVTLTMVLPNYTSSVPGPVFSASQLGFVALVSLVLYVSFVMVQTVRHRDYFLVTGGAEDAATGPASKPSLLVTGLAGALRLLCLEAVVLLGKGLAPAIAATVLGWGAPHALVGVIIAMVVLLPESLAALRAARANRLQTSMNLALGSALASIGLTIPAVAVLSIVNGWPLVLGIDAKSIVLLVLSLFVAQITLATGRSTVLPGVVHLVIFAVYLFTTVVP